jgi:hypothetical protein
MNMRTENEISLLADQELDAVVGGMMNDGKQQLINKDQRGVPGTAPKSDNAIWRGITEGIIFLGIAFGAGMSSTN